MADGEWFYNVEKKRTEQGPPERGFADTRLGPFATEGEAAQALDQLHKRNEQQDESDREWREGS